MEKVQHEFVEAKEKVKGKSRMEERKRGQRELKRKRDCSGRMLSSTEVREESQNRLAAVIATVPH